MGFFSFIPGIFSFRIKFPFKGMYDCLQSRLFRTQNPGLVLAPEEFRLHPSGVKPQAPRVHWTEHPEVVQGLWAVVLAGNH